MIEDAEASGRIKPGDTLIEPTSGNTGIGLALAAALKGYRMIITLPEKMSQEKVDVLKALGAEIIRTPTEAAFDSPESHIGVAKKLNKEIPNSHILDQYANPSNPLAHYDGTAMELWEQCEGKIDMIVMTAGTGGTLSGVARRLKELNPHVLVVGVDPKGSILAEPEPLNDEKRLQSYIVEGIGYDFIPQVLDRSLVDFWVKTDDAESLVMARRLIREEGLLCGGSSGAALAGAIRAAKSHLKKGQRCVVLLPDSVRTYMSKHLNDTFMWNHGFVSAEHHVGVGEASMSRLWWATRTVAELGVPAPITVTSDLTASRAVELLTANAIDQLPVVDESNNIVGVLTEGNLTAKLGAGRMKASDPISKALFKQFKRVTVTTPLADLARAFDKDPFAVVVQTQKLYMGGAKDGGVTERHVVVGVVSRIDLLRFITAGAAAAGASEVASPALGRVPSSGSRIDLAALTAQAPPQLHLPEGVAAGSKGAGASSSAV
jgi:cystathionine beta-synthase